MEIDSFKLAGYTKHERKIEGAHCFILSGILTVKHNHENVNVHRIVPLLILVYKHIIEEFIAQS